MTEVLITTTGTGSFTVPADVTEITVEAWGGGGSGQTAAGQGSGGGGGAYISATISVVAGDILYYSVSPANSAPTVNTTWFRKNVNSVTDSWRAGGGNGGAGGGAGGAPTNGAVGTLVTSFSGGAGAAAQGGGGSRGGSGGGGAAGPSGAGSAGVAGSGASGGAGGAANNGTVSGGVDQNGTFDTNGGSGGAGGDATVLGWIGGAPGGGGGGGGSGGSKEGGGGGRGQLRITYTVSSTAIAPASASHGHSASSPTLASAAAISPASGSHGHSASSPTISLPAPFLVQEAFRWRADNGSETSATWMAPINNQVTPSRDQNVRVRFLIKNTGAAAATVDGYLAYRINGGAWTTVVAGSGAVRYSASVQFAQGAATTQQLGAGTFVAGKMFETNDYLGSPSVGAGQETEFEYCIQFITAQLNAGAVVELGVKRVSNGALDAVTNAISFTLPTPFIDQNSFRWRNDDGSEATATWRAAANVNPSNLPLDTNIRLRFLIQNTGTWPASSRNYWPQVRKNGGAWNYFSFQSDVSYSDSTNLTNMGATTQQLGVADFTPGQQVDANAFDPMSLPGSFETEHEFCFQFSSANVTYGATYDFRYTTSLGDFDSYTRIASYTVPALQLPPDSATHAHAATSPSVAPKASLVVASGAHAHAATSPVVASKAAIAVDAATHAHAATSPVVASKAAIAVDAATHAHAATSPTLASAATIAVDPATHAHVGTSPTMGSLVAFSPDPGAIAHAASSPTLASAAAITIDPATHAHAASSPTIGSGAAITVASATHAHQATPSTVTTKSVIAPDSGVHAHVAGEPIILWAASIGANDGVHSHAATSPPVTFEATQALAAVADLSNSNWKRSDLQNGDLFPLLDEGDEDWIYNTNAPAVAEFALTPAQTPNRNTDHRIRYRISGNGVNDLVVGLYSGAALIAQWTETAPGPAPATVERVLSTTEADAIGSYADLRIRFSAA